MGEDNNLQQRNCMNLERLILSKEMSEMNPGLQQEIDSCKQLMFKKKLEQEANILMDAVFLLYRAQFINDRMISENSQLEKIIKFYNKTDFNLEGNIQKYREQIKILNRRLLQNEQNSRITSQIAEQSLENPQIKVVEWFGKERIQQYEPQKNESMKIDNSLKIDSIIQIAKNYLGSSDMPFQNRQNIHSDSELSLNFMKIHMFIDQILIPQLQARLNYPNRVTQNHEESKREKSEQLDGFFKNIYRDLDNFAQTFFPQNDQSKKMFEHLQNLVDHHIKQIERPNFIQEQPKLKGDRISMSKFLINMIILALSEKTPLNWETIKDEMARLMFVGDSAINLSVVLHLILNEKNTNNEKDLDIRKISLIKTTQLEKKCKETGIENLLLQQIPMKICDENINKAQEGNKRSSSEVITCLIGLFSVYIGIESSILMAYDFGIIEELPGALKNKELNLIDVNQKIEIIQELNLLRRNIYVHNYYKHFITYLYYKNIKEFNDTKIDSKNQGESVADFHKDKTARLVYLSTYTNIEPEVMGILFDQEFQKQPEISQSQGTTCMFSTNKFQNYKKLRDSNFGYQKELEGDENGGYIFKLRSPLTEAFTHKSASEKLGNFINLDVLNKTILKELMNDMEKDGLFVAYPELREPMIKFVDEIKDECIIEDFKEQIGLYNYQRNEYLGDSLLNFSLAKHFYLESFQPQEDWHYEYFQSNKLHDLKTFFTANAWLAFVLIENFYFAVENSIRKEIMNTLEDYSLYQDKKTITIPYLINNTNASYESQLRSYQNLVFENIKMFQKGSLNSGAPRDISLSNFKIDSDENSEFDHETLGIKYMKVLSDIHEALIGSIYIDSGNFNQTYKCIIKLISSRLINQFPLKENPRTRVLNIINSKKYGKDIKISHSIEEKDDDTIIKSYMNVLEARRVKFRKEQKKKVSKAYIDLQKFLEEAYIQFELFRCSLMKDTSSEKFIEFLKEFRKKFKIGQSTKDLGIFPRVAMQINEDMQQLKKTQGIQTQEISLLEEFEKVLTKKCDIVQLNVVDYGSQYQEVPILIALEHERTRNQSIRSMLLKAQITHISAQPHYSLNHYFNKVLQTKQKQALFEQLKKLGEILKRNNQKSQEAKQVQGKQIETSLTNSGESTAEKTQKTQTMKLGGTRQGNQLGSV